LLQFCQQGDPLVKHQGQEPEEDDDEWSSLDMAMPGIVLSTHMLCLFVPSPFSWGTSWVAVALYIATGLFGIVARRQQPDRGKP